jgi:hypothetical protein
MSEERFQLGGFRVLAQHEERPECLARGRRLCKLDTIEQKPTKAKIRMLRSGENLPTILVVNVALRHHALFAVILPSSESMTRYQIKWMSTSSV